VFWVISWRKTCGYQRKMLFLHVEIYVPSRGIQVSNLEICVSGLGTQVTSFGTEIIPGRKKIIT
jgi:hypothetical protein